MKDGTTRQCCLMFMDVPDFRRINLFIDNETDGFPVGSFDWDLSVVRYNLIYKPLDNKIVWTMPAREVLPWES